MLPRTGFCAQRNNELEALLLARLPWHPAVRLERAAAFCYYKPDAPYSRLILDFKYHGLRYLARDLGMLMWQENDPRDFFSDGADFLVPVPIHRRRMGQRGYNQSVYLAKGFERMLSIPVRNDGICRVRNTPSQTGLSHEVRRENLHGAFRWDKAQAETLRGRHIVLVDDVITTGTTIAACVEALCEALGDAPEKEPVRLSVLCLGFSHG